MLEACTYSRAHVNCFLVDKYVSIVASYVGGRLEESLTQYKRSKENGVDRAEVHIRNVCFLQITWHIQE